MWSHDCRSSITHRLVLHSAKNVIFHTERLSHKKSISSIWMHFWKMRYLPFKVALTLVTSITLSCIRSMKLYPKVEVCLPLQVAQEANCSCTDPARWQHDPDPMTELQVHGGVRKKNSMRASRFSPWLHTWIREVSVSNKYSCDVCWFM